MCGMIGIVRFELVTCTNCEEVTHIVSSIVIIVIIRFQVNLILGRKVIILHLIT